MPIVRRGLVAVTMMLGLGGSGWLAGGGPGTVLAAVQKQYYVAPGGTNTNCFTNSKQHPAGSVEWVLANCVTMDNPPPSAPDIIHIAAGTYYENDTITGNVNLLGAGAGNTTIDASYNGSVVHNQGYSVGITGITLRDGGNDYGGGIDNHAFGTVKLNNSLVTHSEAGSGGGIFNDYQSTMTLVNTPVTFNQAGEGAGILNAGNMTLNNSPVYGSFAEVGGGILNVGTMTLTNSRVSDNVAEDGPGGGIFNVDGGFITLVNSPVGGTHPLGSQNGTFKKDQPPINDPTAGNSADEDGGGLANSGASANLLNSPVSSNEACGNGGGISNENGGTVSAQNSVITNNYTECTSDGGGIYNDATTNSKLTLKNENINHNVAYDDGGGLYNNGDEPDAEGPGDSCSGLLDVTMTTTVITQNYVDNC